MDAKDFSLFRSGLPHDAMHDILEGIAPQQIKRLIDHCTSNGYFSLQEFNKRLVNFNYGYTERDRPVPILSHTVQAYDKPLRGSASQTLLLIRVLLF